MFTTHTPRDTPPPPDPCHFPAGQMPEQPSEGEPPHPLLCVAAKKAMDLQRAASPKLPSFPMLSLVPETTTFSSADAINNPDLGWF